MVQQPAAAARQQQQQLMLLQKNLEAMVERVRSRAPGGTGANSSQSCWA